MKETLANLEATLIKFTKLSIEKIEKKITIEKAERHKCGGLQ